jgi:tetraacyldisaccharide 4'-kinase
MPVRLISYCYRSIVALRRLLYDCGAFRAKRLNAPVLSIGNLSMGGSGKTPATFFLAEQLAPHYHVAILSRGYKSPSEHKKSPTLVSERGKLFSTAALCGDEPFLLAKNLPQATVIAGKNRFLDGELAIKLGATYLLLDDGFQHCQLHRDKDILIVDAHNPFPAERLRDFSWQLKRASLILLNSGSAPLSKEATGMLLDRIHRLSSAPVVQVSTRVVGVFDAQSRPLTLSPHTKVVAACGIAQPKRFEETLTQTLNLQVVERFSWSDHCMPCIKRLEERAVKGKTAEAMMVLCTEKDYVRFEQVPSLSLPLGWVKIRMRVDAGKDLLDDFLKRT